MFGLTLLDLQYAGMIAVTIALVSYLGSILVPRWFINALLVVVTLWITFEKVLA